MPVGEGSIKRAAKTAVVGNPENLEKAASQTEKDAAQTEGAVKEAASASGGKKAPARKNTAKTGAKRTAEKSSAKKTYGINDELPIYLM